MTDEARERYHREAARSAWRWRVHTEGCPLCREWIGHFGGSAERDPCKLIPADVPLEELRPNCYDVRRPRIGDAIRAALSPRRPPL